MRTDASTACANCRHALEPLVDDIQDWEYGVPWKSRLVICGHCGLVTQDPPVRPEQVPLLYPDNYLAHSPASASRSVYGRLKTLLGKRNASRVSEKIPPSGSCLEVGCGNGSFLALLGELRADIALAGVDIRDLGVSGIQQFTFYEGQLEDIDFAGRRFDVIYCSNLIEHVPDPHRFLAACTAILNPGGVIYGITPDHLSIDRYIFKRYWAGYHYPRHTFLFNHDNIVQILERAGFDEVDVRGSYGFWYLSIANRTVELPGTKKRGLAFAAVTAALLPFDLAVNLVRCHGSMRFIGHWPG